MKESKNINKTDYIVFARKYRPQVFEQVIGQDHVVRTLINALESGRIAQAYLFTGPRGVGKTTMARIMAKSLNCAEGTSPVPCCACSNCVEIAEGRSLDVFEIDGASNRGIDEIRELRETALFGAAASKYKIYIIDEVHMLTDPAFNALLKILEEPPPHVKFIFATTDAHKILGTIVSRCQRYDFKQIPTLEIMRNLDDICAKEGITADKEALRAIAAYARGGLRDAQSTLDQMAAFRHDTITYKDVVEALGIIHTDTLMDVCRAVVDNNAGVLLARCREIFEYGKSSSQFVSDILELFRNIMVLRYGTKDSEIEVYFGDALEEAKDLACKLSLNRLTQSMDILLKAQQELRYAPSVRAVLDLAFLKIVGLAQQQETPLPAQKSQSSEKTLLPAVPERQKSSIPADTPSGISRSEDEQRAFQRQHPAPVERQDDEPLSGADETNRHNMPSQPDADEDAYDSRDSLHDALLDYLRGDMLTKSHLAHGRISRTGERSFLITFGKDTVLHREHIEQKTVMDRIEGALQKIVNISGPLTLTVREEQTRNGPENSVRVMNKSKYLENPVVQKLVSTFDGEIEAIRVNKKR